MASFRDEELFIQTQPQEDESGEGDDVYIHLEKEITVRKCKIIQKKEKIRVLVKETKKQCEILESAIKERELLKNVNEELRQQKHLRIQNIKKAQASRAALETTVCDLTNKLSLEKAERKRRKDIYDAAIKDISDTWESYKEEYDNFPLAQQLKQKEIEVKNAEIAIKQTEFDIADFKNKKKLKKYIAEKRFHGDVVKLAEKYKQYQKETEELKELHNKITEMRKCITDIKSGKSAVHKIKPSEITVGNSNQSQPLDRSIPETVQFSIPGVQVTFPPINKTEFIGRNFFDCGFTALESSKKQIENTETPLSNVKVTMPTSTSTVGNLQTQLQKVNTPAKVGSSVKLSNLLSNLILSQEKHEIDLGNKRHTENITQAKVNIGEIPPSKKVCHTTSQKTKHPRTDVTKPNSTVVNEKTSLSSIKKHMGIKNLLNSEKKENMNLKMTSSPSDGKLCMLSIGGKDKPTTAATQSTAVDKNSINLPIKDLGNEMKSLESLMKNGHERAETVQATSGNIQHNQQKSYSDELLQNSNENHHNQPVEHISMLLEPGSPAPDLIPVETSNQPLSQEYNSQESLGFNLSQESDFISPADCDEATKAVYARLESEYMASEDVVKVVTRSQYFSESSTLNTPSDTRANTIYQPATTQMFSPPLSTGGVRYDNSSQFIPSPPPADLGNEDGRGSAAGLFSSGYFNSGPSNNTSNKSFFDFL